MSKNYLIVILTVVKTKCLPTNATVIYQYISSTYMIQYLIMKECVSIVVCVVVGKVGFTKTFHQICRKGLFFRENYFGEQKHNIYFRMYARTI